MPATYNGDDTGIAARDTVAIDVPVGSDPPNAASVTTPLDRLADFVAFVMNKAAVLGAGVVNNLVLDLQGPSEFSPALQVENTPTSRKEIARFKFTVASGTPIYARIYASLSAGGLEMTVNARWDGTNWNYDYISGTPSALSWRLSTTTPTFKRFTGAGPTWNDAGWTTTNTWISLVTFAAGLTVTQSNADTVALSATGNGTGQGVTATGGGKGAAGLAGQGGTQSITDNNGGHGVTGVGGAGNGVGVGGDGVAGQGAAQGNGVSGTGGAGGAGGYFVGGTGNTTGAAGFGNGTGQGVYGESVLGIGVEGHSTSGRGVQGHSSTSGAGVWGESSGGCGTQGNSSTNAGARGDSTSGAGVFGNSSSGPGVQGQSASGPGGFFGSNATRAHLNLAPGSKPSTPQEGDLFFGKNAVAQGVDLYIYGKGSDGVARWYRMAVDGAFDPPT